MLSKLCLDLVDTSYPDLETGRYTPIYLISISMNSNRHPAEIIRAIYNKGNLTAFFTDLPRI